MTKEEIEKKLAHDNLDKNTREYLEDLLYFLREQQSNMERITQGKWK